MLRGVQFIDKKEKQNETKKHSDDNKNSLERHHNTFKVLNVSESQKNYESQTLLPSSENAYEYTNTKQCPSTNIPPEKDVINNISTKGQREEWMLGDFESLFPNDAKSRRNQTQTQSSSSIVASRELNPYYQNGGTGLPPVSGVNHNDDDDDDNTVGPKPVVTKKRSITVADYTVGDAGRSWRARAERRRTELENTNVQASSSETQLKQGWKKNKIEHLYDGKNKVESFNSKMCFSKMKTDENSTEKEHHLISNTDNDGQPEDANSLATQALRLLMIGDDEGYRRLEQKKDRLLAEQKQQQTNRSNETSKNHSSFDSSSASHNRKQECSSSQNFRGHRYRQDITRTNLQNDDNSMSIESLHKAERLKGSSHHHFERNLAHHVLRKGRHYVDTNDDDDNGDFAAVGRWENFYDNEKSDRKFKKQRRPGTWRTPETQREMNTCLFCPEGSKFDQARKDTLISMSTHAYLCYQSYKQCVVKYHFFIAPTAHVSSSPALDEDVYQEIRNYQKSLIRYLDMSDCTAVFVECMRKSVSVEKAMLGGGSHLVIDCFGIPVDKIEDARMYFKRTLLEVGQEWSQHKKIIDVPKRSNGCRSALPKNFPYFYVDFSLNGGMAHVVEDDDFPPSLGRDVIQGMMGLDKTEKNFATWEDHAKAVTEFKTHFKPYDWTQMK